MKTCLVHCGVIAVSYIALAGCRDGSIPTAIPETRHPRLETIAVVAATTNGYVAIDLGTLGGAESVAYAINNFGQIAGESTLPGDAVTHAFRWDGGVMTDLGTLGGNTSQGVAINALGQVVGFSHTAEGLSHAFRWDAGVMTDLGTLGGRFSFAVDINALGQVTGASETGALKDHAFRWEGGVMMDLGTLGGDRSEGRAINAAGNVAGISTTTSGEQHAFIWKNGVMTDLGTLGGSLSEAVGINDLDQVVGTSLTAAGETHSFLWQNGTMVDIGSLGGESTRVGAGFFCRCKPLNNLGQVTGSSFTEAGVAHAFAWHDGVMTDLGTLGGNTILGEGSVGFAFNNVGQVTGESTFPGSGFSRRAFLWRQGVMVNLGTLGGDFSRGTAINDYGQVAGFSSTAGELETHATIWRVITPVEQISSIITEVLRLQTEGALGEGQANSLVQKLLGATALLNDTKMTPAVNKLQAFINEVIALASGLNSILTAEQAQDLIDAANSVMNALTSGAP
jgi:probable HAF family extracellular repeat protein